MKSLENTRAGLRARPIDKARAAELGVRFAMGFLLGRTRIFGSFAPFGPALVGAAPQGAPAAVSLLGVCLGALTAGSFGWSVKYIAISILIWAADHFFADGFGGWFPMAVTFGFSLLIGFVYAWDSGFEVRATAMWAVECFTAPAFVYFYGAALSPWSDRAGRDVRSAHTAGAVLTLATLLMALTSPMLFGVLSLGRAAAVTAVLFVIYRGGISMGSVAAAALGAAMDLAQGGAPFFLTSYVFSALLAGVFQRSGRLRFCLAWCASTALTVLWFWSWRRWLPALYETFAATVVFMLLPDPVLARAAVYLPSESAGLGFMKAREYAKDRVERCADAFSALFEAVRARAGDSPAEDVSEIFDGASNQVCRSCPHAARCWQERYQDTVDVMNNLIPQLLSSGSVGVQELPEHFLTSCERSGELVNAINSETHAFLTRRQYRSRLALGRTAAFRQYGDVSSVLRSLARELGNEIEVEPGLERKLQKYLRGLAIDGSAAVFRVRGGRLRAEIRSQSLHLLRRDKLWLDKLSAVLGTRLCTGCQDAASDRLVLLEAEPYAVRVGEAGIKKPGEAVSGDVTACFRTDEGFLYVILSDGMGSGEAASRTASQVSGILERFLSAGVRPELALKILSDLMLLRCDDELESASVDLLALNMFTGEAALYKYGAAPSYLRRGGAVRRLSGGALPVGIDDRSRRAGTRLPLPPGSLLVLTSDGLDFGDGGKWLRGLISGFSASDPKELASAIIDEAAKRLQISDDVTVVAITVEDRA